jgi:hypothetical protein
MRTERLGLVLTKQEKQWIIKLAELEGGLTQAALIRRLIRRKAVEHHLCPTGTQYLTQVIHTHNEEMSHQKEELS